MFDSAALGGGEKARAGPERGRVLIDVVVVVVVAQPAWIRARGHLIRENIGELDTEVSFLTLRPYCVCAIFASNYEPEPAGAIWDFGF